MNILFDQNVPKKLRRNLRGHVVTTASVMDRDRAAKNNWPFVKIHADEIAAAVSACVPGSYIRVLCGR